MAKLALTFYSVLRNTRSGCSCAVCARSPRLASASSSWPSLCLRDGAAVAAAIACNTRTIRLGTSVFRSIHGHHFSLPWPWQPSMALEPSNGLSWSRVRIRNRTEDYFGIKIERPLEDIESMCEDR